MPGTTRYSATFDRTYEEDDRVDPSPPPNARRSRSQSWQANSGLDTRPYTPLGIRPLNQRSSSTDNGSAKPTEHIPTRTVVKTVVKPHTNPFQFVKVGTCPLYKKAEEQLKKVKEVKKPDVLKEEEEEWQTNLDSWKSRRRKMSEDVFRRQEEIKQFELEEQVAQEAKKKTKTFSEMVESRAHRGRALSLCLISSPLELTNWEFESNSHKNGSCSTFSGESEENSTVNSEDEGVSLKNISDKTQNSTFINHRTNGDSHIENNTSNSSDFTKLDLSTSTLQIKPKEGSYIDSGLESISSHRAGDTPDSGSDFSHDSGSSIDCDSPRTGVNILEEFSVKSSQNGNVPEFSVKLCLNEKELDFGFTFLVKKDEGRVIISSISEGGKADLSSIHTGDQIISINGEEVSSKTQREIVSLIQKGRDKGELDLLLWRHTKCTDTASTNGFKINGKQPCEKKSSLPMSETQAQKYERSVESDNEMYVDDFEELERQVELMTSSKSEMHSQNANIQKVYTSAKEIEESSLDTLNVVFQSQPKNLNSEKQLNSVKTSENSINKAPVDLVPDVLPVEKVAEEMEKLILEQLEEEERAKELASGLLSKSPFGSPEHLLTAPPKLAEPPKEKPPPPPPPDTDQKDPSLKRVNSTKRIKKEIHKRRSNFLGIDSAEESLAISEPCIPPPPALEEILKAEMELDRQTRLQIDNAATERLTLEENEIIQKEREIIETLESEERCKQLINGTADFYDAITSNESDVAVEEQIKFLKSEQKRLEIEKINEEQQLRLMEDTHLQELKEREEFILKEREEFIRKQEAGKSAVSDSSLSVASKVPNTLLPSLSTDTQSQVSNSDAIGDGNILTSSTDLKTSKDLTSDSAAKVPPKPAVPPKPLKKKEAIRKERERLRQEQEALQREREEHRQKLLQEQEELLKHQKAHAPDAPVPRLGVLPPLVPPSFQTPLTNTPFVRDNASHPSRSHHGASNVPVRSNDTAELMSPVIAKQSKMPPARKPVQNETWGQQKVTSVRKQNHDSLTENRYNQNHWLIQEAEMRRIAELRDRQRTSQLSRSQPNLAEDDVCSNVPRVPMIPPSHNQHLNYAVQDKMWNYNQPNVMPIKKYPPPIVTRETVSQQPPVKPSRVVPMERQEQMLSVSGRKRCSHCNEELGRGAAMIIESLQLYYHIHCFQCCVCQAQLGNGSCGADVRVRNQKLHCHNCYSNDEAGLKFSQV